MSMCVPHTFSAQGELKRALEILDLEFQMFLSFHMGAGNQSKSSVNESSAVECGAISSAPSLKLLIDHFV